MTTKDEVIRREVKCERYMKTVIADGRILFRCEEIENVKGCETCMRQGCAYRDGTVRVNCPLWKESAV